MEIASELRPICQLVQQASTERADNRFQRSVVPLYPHGEPVDEVTVWDSICNLTGKRYSYRTVSDPTVYVVDLTKVDFTAPARTQDISWSGNFVETVVS